MSEDEDILRRALERERGARKQAEQLLEQKTREVYLKNEELKAFAGRLEQLVAERTRELAVARDEAVAASLAKSQFLANMSHELRTPLNAIIGYGEILEEDARSGGRDAQAADLRKIIGSGRHLMTLINDILDLSKIEAGQMGVSIEDVELEPLVRDLYGAIGPLVAKNGNRFELQLVPGLGTIQSDPTKLKQILINVVSNAGKFTERGTVWLRAERGCDELGEHVRIAVRDTGLGMSPDQVAGLFAPFKQADGSAARKHGGTGLGLALTERFCALIGAGLSVDSQLGAGSTFTVRLPIALEGARP